MFRPAFNKVFSSVFASVFSNDSTPVWFFGKDNVELNLPLLTDLYDRSVNYRDATFARASGGTVTDFEGNVKTVKVDEARFQGARRVEQLVTSQDLTTWAAIDATTPDSETVTFTASSGANINLAGVLSGRLDGEYTLRFNIKSLSGVHNIRFQASNASASADLVVTETSRLLSVVANVVNGNNATNIYFLNGSDGLAWSAEIQNIQVEDVTNQSNQAPSEFVDNIDYGANVDGVRYFDYLNASSVDANGVVTEAAGAAITDIAGLLVEEESTNLCRDSNDISGVTWTGSVAADDYESFTPAAINDARYVIVTTVDSESYTLTCKVKSDGNTGLSLRHTNSGDSGSDTAITATTEWQTFTKTFTGRAGGGSVQCGVQDGNASGFGTIYVKDFQVENKPYATSLIPTSGATATRLADNAQVAFPTGLVNDFVMGCESEYNDYATNYSLAAGDATANYYALDNVSLSRGRASTRIDAATALSSIVTHGEASGTIVNLKGRKSATSGIAVWANDAKGPDQLTATADLNITPILNIGMGFLKTLPINGTIRNVNLINGDLYDWEVLGEPMPEPVFKALNNAADVQTGVGGLTTAWASGGYVWNGSVYEAVAPNTPIWVDGWLQYYPEATNSAKYSRDFTSSAWTKYNGATAAFNKGGLDGTSDSASIITGTGTTAVDEFRQQNLTGFTTGNPSTVAVWVHKTDWTGGVGISIGMAFTGATAAYGGARLNMDTGVITNKAAANISISSELVSEGDWHKILIQYIDTSGTANINGYIYVYPATDDAGLKAAGTKVIGNLQLHKDKTIAECRDLPPVFTESSAVTMNRTAYSFDIANHDNAQGAWYCEYEPSLDRGEITDYDGLITFATSIYRGIYIDAITHALRSRTDAATSEVVNNFVGGEPFKVGISYSIAENKQVLNSDNVSGNEPTYDGFVINSGILVFNNGSAPAKIRNLRRYDTDYSVSKQIIEVLMK